MKRLRNWFGLRCWLKRCPHHWREDNTGCGGKCVDYLSGWMTSAELRAIADRMLERGP